VNFEESEAYLYSLGNEVEAMKLGLDNVRTLLTNLGSPERKYLKVQIAGTNGKGSVCAFLNSICLEAGIRTGLYTSPHLVSVTERVKINGIDIGGDDFALFATRIRAESERLVEEGDLENVPTFFEQVTAIALLAFAEARIELAILETGLGGRFDAVTATNAEISAITRIDYDHQRQLGETIEEIAEEKAAIIRHDSQIVIGEQGTEAKQVLLDRCVAVGVEPVFGEEILTPIGEDSSDDKSLAFKIENEIWITGIGLAGRHQVENAKVAIQLARILQMRFKISTQQILSGIKNARHPGRLEWIGNFLLDGAHNIGGARALAGYIDEFVEKPITMF
jgi:dihydrofolate synthase/folylpolyglutamate synthase